MIVYVEAGRPYIAPLGKAQTRARLYKGEVCSFCNFFARDVKR